MTNGRSGADGAVDFGGGGGRREVGDQGEAEVEGGSSAAGGEDFAIGHGALGGEDGGELVGDTWVSGVAASGKQAGVVEDGGRGTNGGKPGSGLVVLEHEGEHPRVGAEAGDTGSAGKHQGIGDGRGRRQVGEQAIGFEHHRVATGDAPGGAEGGDGDGHARAAKDVNGGDGFEFFKTLWQDDKDRGHGSVIQ